MFAAVLTVQANPSFFVNGSATSSVSTSTLTYMTAGAATTTLIQPFYVSGNTNNINSATLLVQFTGSSTASSLKIEFEYADNTSGTNCETAPTTCDWYRDDLLGTGLGVVGTTSQVMNLNLTNSVFFSFSSTSLQGSSALASRTNKIINVQTPSQYVRAVITMPAGSLNGAVWAKWLPVKEQAQ